MIEDLFLPFDETEKSFYEQFRREEEQRCKEIKLWLYKAGYIGAELLPNNGLIFITNKAETKREQIKWLKKYCEVLYTYGIKTEVDENCDEPYICI